MKDRVEIVVPGEPRGKARARTLKSGRTYTPQGTKAYEALVQAAYWQAYMGSPGPKFAAGEPLRLTVDAFMKLPASASKKKLAMMLSGALRPAKKPDWDNIGKVVSDALTGLAYPDDAQVVEARVRKFYSESPRAVITVEAAPAGPGSLEGP